MPTTTAVLRGASSEIPVYNVSMPLLKRHFPERPAFRILEFTRPAESRSSAVQAQQLQALTDRIGAPT